MGHQNASGADLMWRTLPLIMRAFFWWTTLNLKHWRKSEAMLCWDAKWLSLAIWIMRLVLIHFVNVTHDWVYGSVCILKQQNNKDLNNLQYRELSLSWFLMLELGVVLADWKASVTASNVFFNVPKNSPLLLRLWPKRLLPIWISTAGSALLLRAVTSLENKGVCEE